MAQKNVALEPFVGRFQAMGCPCEILLDSEDAVFAAGRLAAARREAERIEARYSRYRPGSLVQELNRRAGTPMDVDPETAALLDYAAECFDLSKGLFDITTGGLRKGADRPAVGWDRVAWRRPRIELPAGFEIDFGGICKEYAADRILALLREGSTVSTLVNLGGDIAAAGERLWSVGIEDPAQGGHILRMVYLKEGGVATSGTTKRGGHILNPKTGGPVERAPSSVTVAARTCTEAGFWSTLAVLQGAGAEDFLKAQALEAWCDRVPEPAA